MDMSADSTRIAGWKTAADWQAMRSTLVVGSDSGAWQRALEDYFQERLRLRYLNPIRVLQEHGTFQGEGFSILAIQCSLIEFLASTVQGLTYRHLRKGETLGPYEYDASSALFVHFLCNRHPFATQFNEPLAWDFYVSIRCGLLHEARTKNGRRVWAIGPIGTIVDGAKRIVYRDNFQVALDEFIAWYGTELLSKTELKEAFIRKFDSLCQ
jgi:hypothetical protein